MKIRVRGYLTFKEVIGDRLLQINDAEKVTLAGLLEKLSLECGDEVGTILFDPEIRGVRRDIAILVNGVHYTHLPDRLDSELKDGDEVAIFPPIAGGED